MPEFLWLAIAAGIGVAITTGPLGSFIVWRRMAYFGDTLAHSALLGTALGLVLHVAPTISVIASCILLALILTVLQRQRQLAVDTLLGIMAHSSLALGLVVIALLPNIRIDLMALLFGDLLSVTPEDIIMIFATAAVVLGVLLWLWRPLLAITVHEDLAKVEGVPVTFVRTALMTLIALAIAIAMKAVGVLLITALMVIPAATARRFANSPEQMAILAAVIGSIAVLAGLLMSWYADTPAGPSVVLSATSLFLLSLTKPGLHTNR
ncbi:zinc ABC transporter permease subunit ZnuB [Porticoccaceae bacterium LTM1]|nr:zinc ABC transporter permease subunit ZnuB [Porticoccaceae bacterium LTM1]